MNYELYNEIKELVDSFIENKEHAKRVIGTLSSVIEHIMDNYDDYDDFSNF